MPKIEEFSNSFRIDILSYNDKSFGIQLVVQNISTEQEAKKFADILSEWLVSEGGAYKFIKTSIQ